MPTSQGFLTKCGFRKETDETYNNTAVALTNSSLIPYKSESIQIQLKTKDDESLIGYAGKVGQDIIGKLYSGSIDVVGQYQGLDTLFACVLGHSQYYLGTHQIETTAYRHIYVPDSNLHTDYWKVGEVEYVNDFVINTKKIRRGTLAINKVVSVWEYLSTMINKMTIKGNTEGITFTFDVLAGDLNTNSAVNTISLLNSLTFTSYPTILFQELTATIGDFSISQEVSDILKINEFEITIDNLLQSDLQTSESGLLIEEPVRNGFRSVSGSISFPRYSNDSGWYGNDFINNLINGSNKALKFEFVSSSLAGYEECYKLSIYLPTIKFQSGVPNISNPSVVPHTLNFQAFIPSNYQRGFLEKLYCDETITTTENSKEVAINGLKTEFATAGDTLIIDNGNDKGVYQIESVSVNTCIVDNYMTTTASDLTGRIIHTHRLSEIIIETINKLTTNVLV